MHKYVNKHVDKNAGLFVAKPFSPPNFVTNSTSTVIVLPQTTFQRQATRWAHYCDCGSNHIPSWFLSKASIADYTTPWLVSVNPAPIHRYLPSELTLQDFPKYRTPPYTRVYNTKMFAIFRPSFGVGFRVITHVSYQPFVRASPLAEITY